MLRLSASRMVRKRLDATALKTIAVLPSQAYAGLSTTRITLPPSRNLPSSSVRIHARFMGAKKSELVPKTRLDFNTLVDLQTAACKVYSKNPAFGTRVGDKFEWINYEEFDHLVQKVHSVDHT